MLYLVGNKIHCYDFSSIIQALLLNILIISMLVFFNGSLFLKVLDGENASCLLMICFLIFFRLNESLKTK